MAPGRQGILQLLGTLQPRRPALHHLPQLRRLPAARPALQRHHAAARGANCRRWQTFFDHHGTRFVVARPTAAIADFLEHRDSVQWPEIYHDEGVVVFKRAGAAAGGDCHPAVPAAGVARGGRDRCRERRGVLAPVVRSEQPPPGFVVTGAQIADGTGAPLRRADVRVEGDIDRRGRRRHPAAGRARRRWRRPGARARLHRRAQPLDRRARHRAAAPTQVSQGITTLVVGQDGSSPWPIARLPRRAARQPAGGQRAGAGRPRHRPAAGDGRRLQARGPPDEVDADGGAGRSGDARGRHRPLVGPRVRGRQLLRRPKKSSRWRAPPRGTAASTSRTSATKPTSRSTPSARRSPSASGASCRCRSRTSSSARSACGARPRRSSRSSTRPASAAST